MFTLSSKLRLKVPNYNLKSKLSSQNVRVVMLLTNEKLDTSKESTDWRWIICGQKDQELNYNYKICENQYDPDNDKSVNIANNLILDSKIVSLNTPECCQTCFGDSWWLGACNNDAYDNLQLDISMYDNTISWQPSPKTAASEYWFYTFFMVGDSLACLEHD